MSEGRIAIRKDMASYMNTGTAATPVWSLMGVGFTDLEESKNAIDYKRHYVHEATERTDVVGYATSFSYSADIYTEDPAITRIDGVTMDELIGTSAQVEIVNVMFYKPVTPGGTEYVAYKRPYNVIPDTKAAGVEALILTGTLTASGDQEKGTWDASTSTFTPDP